MADLIKRLQLSEKQYGVGMEENPFADKSPTECMTLNFGGGGSPPPPPPPASVTQQTSNIPEYFQPYLERLFERAEGVTTEPFQQYEGQRLAEVTPEQQTAYQGVEDMVGGYKPYIQTADLLTAQASQQSTDPAAISSRMSPYQQAVIDIQKREALRDTENLQQQIGASAVGAGAYGGSRQALQETELARQTGQRLADIQATGSQQAYNAAMQQLAADRAASLAAGQQFSSLGSQQQSLGLAGLGALETVGGTKQGQEQKALDIAYEDFARETTQPSQQVQEMSSVLRGFNLPVSTYTTSQGPAPYQPGLGQQLLGAGLGVYGLGAATGMFKGGGNVQKFNSGGIGSSGNILNPSTRTDPIVNLNQFSTPYISSIFKYVVDEDNPRNPFDRPSRVFRNPYSDNKKLDKTINVKAGEIPSFIQGRDRMLFEKGLKQGSYEGSLQSDGAQDYGVSYSDDVELNKKIEDDKEAFLNRDIDDQLLSNVGDTSRSSPSLAINEEITSGKTRPEKYLSQNFNPQRVTMEDRGLTEEESIPPSNAKERPSILDPDILKQLGEINLSDSYGSSQASNTSTESPSGEQPPSFRPPVELTETVGSDRLRQKLEDITKKYDSNVDLMKDEGKGMPKDLIAQIGLNLMTGDKDVGGNILAQTGSAVKGVLPEAIRRRERAEDKRTEAEQRALESQLKTLGIETDIYKAELSEAGATDRQGRQIGSAETIAGMNIGSREKIADKNLGVQKDRLNFDKQNFKVTTQIAAKQFDANYDIKMEQLELQRQSGELSQKEFELKKKDIGFQNLMSVEKIKLEEKQLEDLKNLKIETLDLQERKFAEEKNQNIINTNLKKIELLVESNKVQNNPIATSALSNATSASNNLAKIAKDPTVSPDERKELEVQIAQYNKVIQGIYKSLGYDINLLSNTGSNFGRSTASVE